MYFRFIIGQEKYSKFMSEPTTLSISCASNSKTQERFLGTRGILGYDGETSALCDKIEKEIRTQCGGLVEVHQRRGWELGQPVFIHQTAHDFLVETETGKQILSYEDMPAADIFLQLMKSFLYLVRPWSKEPFPRHFRDIWEALAIFAKDAGKTRAVQLLLLIQELYEKGGTADRHDRWPVPLFLAMMLLQPFDTFVMSSMEGLGASKATDVLRDVPWECAYHQSAEEAGLVTEMVRKLISRGADVVAIASYSQPNFMM